MGIDIYLGGYDAYRRRCAKERQAFDEAVAIRNAITDRDSAAYKLAQEKVSESADAMWAGAKGYLRSSYNSGGLFNALDRIFGTDSGALFFPGNWDNDEYALTTAQWEEFLVNVRIMREAGEMLKHGDPPIRFEELARTPNKQRAGGEGFGRMVLEMVATALPDADIEAGNPHAAGFYNADDYGWYLTEGLKDLQDFGALGLKISRRNGSAKVHISY
jgi:hypothetical protein